MIDFDHIKTLIGKQVEVTLTDDEYPQGAVVAKGKLLAFDDGGECVVMDEMGFVHWCWPMLNIREVDGDS